MSFDTQAVIVKADPPCICGSDELFITGENGELVSVTCEQCGAQGSISDVLGHELDIDDADQAQVLIWMGKEPRFVTADGAQARFVNVWVIDRQFGGPEEGGWWYDTGECIKTVVCSNLDEASTAVDTLRETYPHTGKRGNVLGGDDWDVTIDNEPGTFFPKERPHYE